MHKMLEFRVGKLWQTLTFVMKFGEFHLIRRTSTMSMIIWKYYFINWRYWISNYWMQDLKQALVIQKLRFLFKNAWHSFAFLSIIHSSHLVILIWVYPLPGSEVTEGFQPFLLNLPDNVLHFAVVLLICFPEWAYHWSLK